MATLVVQTQAVCSGGEHATLSLTVGGVEQGRATFSFEEIMEEITPAEIEVFIRLLARGVKIGKNKNQLRSALLAGVSFVL